MGSDKSDVLVFVGNTYTAFIATKLPRATTKPTAADALVGIERSSLVRQGRLHIQASESSGFIDIKTIKN